MPAYGTKALAGGRLLPPPPPNPPIAAPPPPSADPVTATVVKLKPGAAATRRRKQEGCHAGQAGTGERIVAQGFEVGIDLFWILHKVNSLACLENLGADRKSTRLNSSHIQKSRMPSSA